MIDQPLSADAVRRHAAAKGIDSSSELARRAGLDRSLVSKLLHGRRRAKPSHVLALAEALEVEVSDLLAEDVPA